jgi:hypothetical protein
MSARETFFEWRDRMAPAFRHRAVEDGESVAPGDSVPRSGAQRPNASTAPQGALAVGVEPAPYLEQDWFAHAAVVPGSVSSAASARG